MRKLFFIISGSLNKFVFDNIDFNISTIDGLNTLHGMGGIRCITTSNSLVKSADIPRLKNMPFSHDVGKLGINPLKNFQKSGKCSSQKD